MIAPPPTPPPGEPIFFGPPQAQLFGWFHAPTGPRRDIVAVICPPIGFDAICSFRSLAVLAEALAAAGIPTTRFDYFGTGNSAGDFRDPSLCDRWRASIHDAVAQSQARTASKRVALIGVRAGALLAAAAAGGSALVTDLVLWAAPRSGRHFVRELRTLARLAGSDDGQREDVFEVAGFPMTTGTALALSELRPPAANVLSGTRALAIGRDDLPDDPTWPGLLSRAGCDVTTDRTAGTAAMLVEPMSAAPPGDLIARIVDWISDGTDQLTDRAAAVDDRPARGAVAVGITEEAIRFGDRGRLFGILTRPERPGSRGVIMLSTGAEYHVGPHGTHVESARRLAAQNMPVLRWDLGGLGESRPPAGAGLDRPYPSYALGDIAMALAEFRQRTGVATVYLIGICSGGWHAFDAARSGLDVQGILAVNAPLYLLEGPDFRLQELWEHQEVERYRESILDQARVLKALRGQVNVQHFARVVARRLTALVRRTVPAAISRVRLVEELSTIDRRGIRAHFAFSRSDLGQTYFETRVSPKVARSLPGLGWSVIDNADHTFRPLSAQDALRDTVDWFAQAGAAMAPSENQRQVSSSPSRSEISGS